MRNGGGRRGRRRRRRRRRRPRTCICIYRNFQKRYQHPAHSSLVSKVLWFCKVSFAYWPLSTSERDSGRLLRLNIYCWTSHCGGGGERRSKRRREEEEEEEEEEDEENEDEAGRARTCETTETCCSLGESNVFDSSDYFRQRQTRKRRRRRRRRPRTCYCIWRMRQKR